MERWSSVGLGLVFATGLVAMIIWARPSPTNRAETTAQSAALPAASSPSADPEAIEPVASSDEPAELKLDPAATEELSTLPPGAPKSIEFGVILVTYVGAQQAPDGARSREQARSLAEKLLEEARVDFKAAVKQGDRGSVPSAGRLPRGVLEPRVEHALFSLEKGALVSEPIDTPRGFWIAKRLD